MILLYTKWPNVQTRTRDRLSVGVFHKNEGEHKGCYKVELSYWQSYWAHTFSDRLFRL